MKFFAVFALCILFVRMAAQKPAERQNIIVITTDGFRWQEVFRGADSAFVYNTSLVKDTGLTAARFWSSDAVVNRQKLMPFLWGVVAQQGQLYGNRDIGNRVNVTNLYKISYPGYNEIFTGHNSISFNPNLPVENGSTNVFEYINKQPGYQGSVVAFSSWNVFPYIFNEPRSQFPVNSGYELLDEVADSNNVLINQVQQQVANQGHTRHDLLTFASAREYIQDKHPKVSFIGFGETDEYAHSNRYDMYLQTANQVDNFIGELWYYLQTDPFYKDHTTLIIATDHGRGRDEATWHKHGPFTTGSGDTWFAVIGPNTAHLGEVRGEQQLYQKQIAQTIAATLGFTFTAEHRVAKAIPLPAKTISQPADANTTTSITVMAAQQ